MLLSCSVAFYYWNEMASMRKQLDLIKDQFFMQSLGQDKGQASPLVAIQVPLQIGDDRHPRMEGSKDNQNPKRYFVDDLGEDMLLVDSKKNPRKENLPVHDLSLSNKGKEYWFPNMSVYFYIISRYFYTKKNNTDI